MEKGTVAAKAPKSVELQAGQTYAWCACGKSNNQPFCDGSHSGSSFKPVVFKQETTETKFLCMCKQTNNSPFCDGTHSSL